MKNKQKFFLPVFVVIVILGVFLIKPQKQIAPPISNDTPVITVSPTVNPSADQVEYPGVDGVDALTLLKQKTEVEQDASGMVISISGRRADNNQHEFWSFYINGQSAQVGPASYITKNNDVIIWKIEKY
jgi:hypothetical protein